MDVGIRGDEARELAEQLLHKYFKTHDYPLTRHHIESYDQFVSQDLPAIIRAENPIILLHDRIGETNEYTYKAEVFIGGVTGSNIYVGTPTVSVKNSEEVRLLFPNEARLRNLTYSSVVEADIVVRITHTFPSAEAREGLISRTIIMDPAADPALYGYLARFPLFRLPIMLHSRYCLLHGKPQAFLKEAGECIYDSGGYFIVNGSEKVLITHQQRAFNTLDISIQERDPKLELYARINCLNPVTRQVRAVSFGVNRETNAMSVSLPMIRKDVPLFVLFRALGIQSDEDILRLIFPNPDDAEAKMLAPMLHESMIDAHPFYDTYSAVQYIKVLTKGYGEAHVLDVLHNKTFVHVEDRPRARAAFLAECVRRILRVKAGIDQETDRDDSRNQRCIASGVLCRMLFQGIYDDWVKAMRLTLDRAYKEHKSMYQDAPPSADQPYRGTNFQTIFAQANLNTMFRAGEITQHLMRAFKGKWKSGSGVGVGEEKTGVIQALSRLSYMDFLSHCRRVVSDFDTGMKSPEPRRLHTSQYGYFCTSETPGGASIGIAKNLSILTLISTSSDPRPVIEWLLGRGGVIACDQITPAMMAMAVPVYVNNGIVGYTLRALALRDVLKALKWTGCLPATAGVEFSARERRLFINLDEGRPMRPLIHLQGRKRQVPVEALRRGKSWRDLVMGVLPTTGTRSIYQAGFVDPIAGDEAGPTLETYAELLAPNAGVIEYVDPYEMNETFVANFPEYIQPETSHLEIHPSTIVGLLTSMIPFANHNQSPRNQLSCSQSKQGLSVYSTAFPSRFDNQAHVLCYGQAPIVRTMYYDYVADGQMGYGHNLILAMGSFTGYNQDDGIVMNADSIARGMFRSTCYRTYEAAEENDPMTHAKTRIGTPVNVPGWTSLKMGMDYTKLDARGIVRVGEMVDEHTVLVGRFTQSMNGAITDASVPAQVWTRGRVEKVVITTNNEGLSMVKVRVVQERIPELGDKFSNRHGQKGTIGMLIRSYDMPRTREGIPVDMIMNPHAMPSRMTVAQLIEAIVGKAAPTLGTVGNGTLFMNEGNPMEDIGRVLRDELGMEPMGEELMYDGMSGQFIPSQIFVGNVYTMRLKHMPEDKWNARGAGRREQRTHQPTAGRGAQGGLRIGEMEVCAVIGHGISDFLRESLMKRSDGYTTYICNSCGTIPVYNEGERLFICPMCDGPVRYIGSTANDLEAIPPNKRSMATFSKVEIPYAFKLLEQELNSYLNMGMRLLTDKDVKTFRLPVDHELTEEQQRVALETVLPARVLPDTGAVPEELKPEEEATVNEFDLAALGAPDVRGALAALEGEEAGAGAPAAAAPVAAAAAAVNQSGLLLQINPSVNVAAAAPAAAAAATGEVEEASFDDVPYASGAATAAPIPLVAPAAAAPPPGTVNVQTGSQPFLIVPMNVGAPGTVAAAPTELIAPPANGAPATLAVDTGAAAMSAANLQPTPLRGQANRSNSASRRMAGAPTVSVNKTGAGVAAANSNPNVRVTVNKTG